MKDKKETFFKERRECPSPTTVGVLSLYNKYTKLCTKMNIEKKRNN